MATAFRQFHLTRSAGNTRRDLDNVGEVHGTKRRNRETGGARERRRVGEPTGKKKKSCSLERLNEVEMCPPQGFPGNYICSANRGGGWVGWGGAAGMGVCTRSQGVVSQNAIRDSAKWTQNVIKPVSKINGADYAASGDR